MCVVMLGTDVCMNVTNRSYGPIYITVSIQSLSQLPECADSKLNSPTHKLKVQNSDKITWNNTWTVRRRSLTKKPL